MVIMRIELSFRKPCKRNSISSLKKAMMARSILSAIIMPRYFKGWASVKEF